MTQHRRTDSGRKLAAFVGITLVIAWLLSGHAYQSDFPLWVTALVSGFWFIVGRAMAQSE
jgi:hypothetical protein